MAAPPLLIVAHPLSTVAQSLATDARLALTQVFLIELFGLRLVFFVVAYHFDSALEVDFDFAWRILR